MQLLQLGVQKQNIPLFTIKLPRSGLGLVYSCQTLCFCYDSSSAVGALSIPISEIQPTLAYIHPKVNFPSWKGQELYEL